MMRHRIRPILHLIALALPLLALQAWAQAPAPQGGLDALQAILERTSVRLFDPSKPVSDAAIKQIMQAGWNARTIDGSRPFEFIEISDRATLETLAGQTKFASWLKNAPRAVAVVVNTKESPQAYKANGMLAVMNMTYKAKELGIGTTFQGTADRDAMKQTLGIGDGRYLLTVLALGAPKPGHNFRSPERAKLERVVATDKLGNKARALAAVTPLERAGLGIGELLERPVSDATAFDNRPVEAQTLRTVFEAARRAPSSKNRQGWRWVLVTDEKQKQEIARAAKDPLLANAPTLAVLARSKKNPPRDFHSQVKHDPHNFVEPGVKLVHYFADEDVAGSLANMSLAAGSLGLGVRVATFEQTRARSTGEVRARKLLSPGKRIAPAQDYQAYAVVGLGYARQSAAQPLVGQLPEARVFSGRWGQRSPR